jgi:hypothetical protein
MLRAFAPGMAANEPLAVPVYGRGRALAVVPLAEVDVPLIEDLSRFLSGPCSCQVKEQNPGFDLPLAVAWDARLFPDAGPPPDTATRARVKSKLVPVAVSGPTRPAQRAALPAVGARSAAPTPPPAAVTAAPRGLGRLARAFAIGLVVVGALIIVRSLRSGGQTNAAQFRDQAGGSEGST